MLIEVEKPSLFDFGEVLKHLDRGYNDCLITLEKGGVKKVIELDGELSLITIYERRNFLEIKVLEGAAPEEEIASYVRDWFDLDRDLEPFYNVGNDQIKSITRKYQGVRLIGIPNLFEAFGWSVIGQQINLRFAHQIKRNLVEHIDRGITFEGKRYHAFPLPQSVLELEDSLMREMKFSRQKTTYLKEVARQMIHENLSSAHLRLLANTQQMKERLVQIKGIGEWTANYILMKTLRRMEAVPYGDSGLNQGLRNLLELDSKPSREEAEEFFNHASGWQAYLAFYVWRSLSD